MGFIFIFFGVFLWIGPAIAAKFFRSIGIQWFSIINNIDKLGENTYTIICIVFIIIGIGILGIKKVIIEDHNAGIKYYCSKCEQYLGDRNNYDMPAQDVVLIDM